MIQTAGPRLRIINKLGYQEEAEAVARSANGDVSAEGTTIAARGGEEVKNPMVEFTCMDCHSQAETKFDLVCNSGHGCDPLPFTPEQLEMAQQSDPRCQHGGHAGS